MWVVHLNFKEGEENFCKGIRWIEIQGKGKSNLDFILYAMMYPLWILRSVDIISNICVKRRMRVYRQIHLELNTSPKRRLRNPVKNPMNRLKLTQWQR